MLTQAMADERAQRGAAALDQIRPGWAAEIRREMLHMNSCLFCVLGQVFGDYDHGLDEMTDVLGVAFSRSSSRLAWATQHGFVVEAPGCAAVSDAEAMAYLRDVEHGYAQLETAWLAAIDARVPQPVAAEQELVEV